MIGLRREAAERGISVYQVRVERARAAALAAGRPLPTAREAVGKGKTRRTATMTALTKSANGATELRLVTVDRNTARRVGRHNALVRAYLEGKPWHRRRLHPKTRLSAKGFRDVMGTWKPSFIDVTGRTFTLADHPEAIAEVLDEARSNGEDIWHYETAA